ncbi:AT-rich interactive domain-containing protein 5B-like [Ylistrum balloti]|uniref:AT-rich interactive domain-containing protein 5B-like n=1 Tax=Ylistrum balloti TaxID=509963 RepID=UPI0029058588|nr:AT-rich interactive domain-containing protein 5B-like [Ylistrum balloti]
MESQKVQFVGASCGKHGPYTFYKAFKYFRDDKFRILTLGEFFFLKILKEGPICIGELQLLWENSQEHQILASVRLYYLPEHTPAGRENYHGEHEILAFSEKLILRLDDLVSLVYLDHVEWGFGLALLHEDSVEGEVQPTDPQTKFFANTQNSGLLMDDVQKEIDVLGEQKTTSTCVKVLSFPQYCRYRTIMKRLENMADKCLKQQIICALGGITSKSHNNRIMFCRDTFDDPDLDDLEVRMDHLAPNLKGRPRKKRSSKSDGNGESDSNETSSDISTPSSRVKASKRESALRNGFRFDKDRISKDEQAFLIDLHKFMKKRHTPIDRIPSLGFKQIDLWYFYTYAQKLGGYEQITRKRLWKHLYDVLGGNPGSTSAATCTRRHYEKLLLPYERYAQEEATRTTVANKQKRKSELLAKARAEAKERLQDAQDSDYDYEEEQHHAFKRLKKVSRNTKTVKSLLNNAEKEKSFLEMKTENGENNIIEKFKIKSEQFGQENKMQQDGNVLKLEKLNGSSASSNDPKQANDSKSIVSQSKLFRADPSQSSNLVTEAGLLQFDRTRLSQISGHPNLPGGGLFYPPFIHMGGLHPLSLPVMHQLPASVQQLIHSPLQPAKSTPSTDKPANHHNTQRSSSQSSSEQRPSVIQHGHQSKIATGTKRDSSPAPQKSHQHGSHISPTYVPGVAAPKAHSGGSSGHLKRSYNSSVPTEAHIPNPQRTHPNNRSLLFDFEAAKKPKMETPPAHSNNSSSNSGKLSSVVTSDADQPCDLSMKTFRRNVHKEDKMRDRNGDFVTDKGSNSPAESPFSVKSLAQSAISSSSSRYASPSLSSRSHLLLDRVHSPDVQANVFSKSSVPSPNIPSVHGNKTVDRPLVPPPAHSNKTSDLSHPSKKTSSTALPSSVPASMHSPTDPSGLLHPAFPNHMVRPQFPQQPYFPSPMQLHQFFEAQIRANAAQAAVYEEMLSHDQRGTYSTMAMPMFLPQVPLHAQAAKDKSHYAHAK